MYIIEIKRFIQVKTREVKGSEEASSLFFGYTLRSKDFRTDPRHVFLLYSDYTNDFIILPMFEYLTMFGENREMGRSHFGIPSFRVGNNKLNNLRYNVSDKTWSWTSRGSGTISFDRFTNKKRMELISNPVYDLNIGKYILSITDLKFKLFYNYSAGRQFVSEKEMQINRILSETVKDNRENIKAKRSATRRKLKSELSPELLDSIQNGYFIKFKGVNFDE